LGHKNTFVLIRFKYLTEKIIRPAINSKKEINILDNEKKQGKKVIIMQVSGVRSLVDL
jgi:hypothetical protein